MKDIQYFKEKYGKGWLRKYNSYKNSIKNKNILDSNGNRRKIYWNDFDYYREQVKLITESNIHHLPNTHKRGFNAYHIDHKISIKWGFENGIPVDQIAHYSNLELIWWKDNIRKSDKCHLDDQNKWILIENDLATPE